MVGAPNFQHNHKADCREEIFCFEGKVLKSMKRIARDLDVLVGSWLEEHVVKWEKNESSDEKQDFIDVMLSVIEEDPTATYGHTRDAIIKGTTSSLIIAGFELEEPMGKPVDLREGMGITLPKASPLEILLTPRLPSQLYQC
ncbi:hypothetical protein L6164_003102 [Bauhinia variegata]|uniref:Uncharacterized protein n=1 Tax=Bauhinia variegata TaxID=167791 RepID=A0ACB9Q0E7_BAUVA|nr:hypothetical protein L6164_003102 [Bauhinia variegata]